MVDYVQIEDYSAKDSLTPADPEKAISGADVDAELAAIAAAVNGRIEDPGVGASGNVLTSNASTWESAAPAIQSQVVTDTNTDYDNTATTTMSGGDVIPQVTQGKELLSATITPFASGDTVLCQVSMTLATTDGAAAVVALFVDGAADAVAATEENFSGAGEINRISFSHVYTTAGTTPVVFTVRAAPTTATTLFLNGGTGSRILGGVSAATLVLTEHLTQ